MDTEVEQLLMKMKLDIYRQFFIERSLFHVKNTLFCGVNINSYHCSMSVLNCKMQITIIAKHFLTHFKYGTLED